MPFTPSHAAAVLPFFRLSRLGVVPSALVIGSMSPDIPYYVPMPVERALSHSFTGVVTIDLALGLVVFVAWQGVVAAGVLAIGPAGLRRRIGHVSNVGACCAAPGGAPRGVGAGHTAKPGLSVLRRLAVHPTGHRAGKRRHWRHALRPAQPAGLRHHFGSVRGVALVAGSLVVGAVTHVVWDTFTHSGTWGTEQFALLREFYGPRPLYRWVQYASGLAGGAVLATAAAWWWRTTPPRHDDRPAAGHGLAFGAWLAVLLAGVVGAAVAALGPLAAAAGADWRAAAFYAATRGGAAAAVTLLLFAVGWAVFARSAGGADRRP